MTISYKTHVCGYNDNYYKNMKTHKANVYSCRLGSNSRNNKM